MRTLLATLIIFPAVTLATPTHEVMVHLTNNTDSQMNYETLTIGHDTRVMEYPREIIGPYRAHELAVKLEATSNRWAKSDMTYTFDLPMSMCENGELSCTETVRLNWQTNMGFDGGEGSICGVSGENYQPLEKVRAYCTLPMTNPRAPETLHIHYFFEYAN